MPWYMTEYKADWSRRPPGWAFSGNYGAYLWARNRERAGRVAKLRGLNERIICQSGSKDRERGDYFPASRMCDRYIQNRSLSTFTDAVHALAFLGMLALASKRARPEQIIGDQGILHEFIHLRLRGALISGGWERVRADVVSIEKRVPGYLRGA
jgi:hypothetical protein